jgi:hypothetical protein
MQHAHYFYSTTETRPSSSKLIAESLQVVVNGIKREIFLSPLNVKRSVISSSTLYPMYGTCQGGGEFEIMQNSSLITYFFNPALKKTEPEIASASISSI